MKFKIGSLVQTILEPGVIWKVLRYNPPDVVGASYEVQSITFKHDRIPKGTITIYGEDKLTLAAIEEDLF